MRKRKLANCQNSEPERQDVAKKPFLQTNRKRTESNETNSPVKKKISIEQPCSSPNRQSQIPRLTQTQNKPNHQTKPKIPTIQDWLSIYQVNTIFIYKVNLNRFSLGPIKIRKMLSTNLSKWHIQIMSDIWEKVTLINHKYTFKIFNFSNWTTVSTWFYFAPTANFGTQCSRKPISKRSYVLRPNV